MFAAELLKEALPEGGKVAVLVASLAKTNAAARVEGFREELTGAGEEEGAEATNFEVLDLVFDGGDPAVCADKLSALLAEDDGVAAVVGTFGYHGPIAIEQAAKLSGDRELVVIAFDEDERTLAGVADGTAYATIVQDPFMFGFEAIQRLEQVRSGQYLEMPIARQVDVGVHCLQVKKDNLEEFRANLAERLASAKTAE